jgi:hypothetical protein
MYCLYETAFSKLLFIQISLPTGLSTDANLVGSETGPVRLIWGHGLGSIDPELKNR